MEKEDIVLVLGSNRGNSNHLIGRALELLKNKLGRLSNESRFYESEAWGKEDQDSFLNKAVVFKTDESAESCLNICLEIENELGRQRENSEKWGPRTIDIDIIYFGNRIIKSENLIVPHPLMQERRFVLLPLSEIIPDFIHPVYKLTTNDLLHRLKDDKEVRPL